MKVAKRKRKKTIIFLYPWVPTRTYHQNLEICIFFFFEIWKICVIFSMKNALYRYHIFQAKIWQNFTHPQKKTLRWTSNPPQENLIKFGSII
jgi:hypothetical protein